MYDWLDAATDETRQVLTASRRLARTLRAAYATRQVNAGRSAWATPAIDEWRDWANAFVRSHLEPSALPITITPYQSKLLWERCLRREISDPLLNVGLLARHARDTWLRLREWCVPLEECQRRAANKDQWLFAQAAVNYQSILEREGWIDETGIPDLVIAYLRDSHAAALPKLLLAGFDRISPKLTQLIAAYRDAGGPVAIRESGTDRDDETSTTIVVASNADGELRSAGHWARRILDERPDARLAIVVTQLEKDAQRSLRLVKEGLVPGWQNAGEQQRAAINMSYGKKLVEYPVIASAVLVLNWLHRDLPTADVSRLLRSTVLAESTSDLRVRAELQLRQFPEQNWSATNVLQCLQRLRRSEAEAQGDLSFVESIAELRKQVSDRRSPAAWVTFFNEILQAIGWPGSVSLSSPQFQTVNRWRELLNEVARLELVSSSMSLAEVLAHLSAIASDTLFQPEGTDAPVHIMGPLEAAGLEFDGIWVTGASSDNWPPKGSSLALLSRDLQRDFGFPDAVPADTVEYAQKVIDRLANSAPSVVFSYPRVHADAMQTGSALLDRYGPVTTDTNQDPGWHASRLVQTGEVSDIADDPVPPAVAGERLHGGAATIQRQFEEPFAAFANGRLGIKTLWPIEPGLPANIRGSLIHDALHRLYLDCPTQQQIQQWDESEAKQRISAAVDSVFAWYLRNADATLSQLLHREKNRVGKLLQGVIEHDRQRESFDIVAVEKSLDVTIEGLAMHLRIDRVERNPAGQSVVVDYKTGSPRRLLDRDKQPKDRQLLVYARALVGDPGSDLAGGSADNIGGIGLMNIDTRQINLDAVGQPFGDRVDWETALPTWLAEVDSAIRRIAAGDVRVNITRPIKESRSLGLLSRAGELRQ